VTVTLKVTVTLFVNTAVDDEQYTGLNLDGGFVSEHFVADAARLVRIQSLGPQRPFEVGGENTRDLSLPGDERDKVASFAVDLNMVAAEKDFLDSVVKAKGEEMKDEGNIAESLVETSAEGSEDNDLFGVQAQGMPDGKLKVGFVFVLGKSNDLCSLVGQRSKVKGHGVQIADDDVRDFAKREGVARSTVGGDDEVVVTQQGARLFQIRQVAVGEDDDAFWEQKILRRRRMAY
jgi:hypothetical protein